ncbi:calponin [Plectosphaerella plurivora]|uniref:Calponin n=1 Tax=Plectosphaerella plurivora TaxID=936078 RepID=A0A9P8VC81_9PEZI|nr:calponin [Plectosphaerella plurivora]
MASVSSLDKDLRKLRLDKYTPAAAREVKAWIEGVLGERLSSADLLEGLKDGVALCKLVNLAIPPPGVKVKQSAMPFVQMENISHFLRACKSPPLNLQDHDVFLTVDLYEQKDPTQVLQCISAFSRAAHTANPSRFPDPIGPKRNSMMSPQSTGPSTPTGRDRGLSSVSNASSAFGAQRPVLSAHKTGDSGSGRWSPTKSPSKGSSPVSSSWSRRDQEGATSPAWNIAQYGYMGGASQGNLGISFGGRRQITSAGPAVPNLADKERRRKEREAEEERQRQDMEEETRRRKAELEAEEARARIEEERRWEQETNRAREQERKKAEEEKRRWEEEERQWKLTEEKRRKEEEEAEARLAEERSRSRSHSNARLQGQFLSQYKAEQEAIKPQKTGDERIRELERELEQAREREKQYELERQGRSKIGGGNVSTVGTSTNASAKARTRSRSRPGTSSPPSRQDSWARGEREFLQTQWSRHQAPQEPQQDASPPPPAKSPRPLPEPARALPEQPARPTPPPRLKSQHTGGSSRPLPDPTASTQAAPSDNVRPTPPPRLKSQHTGGSSRPLPDPTANQPTPPPKVQSHNTGGSSRPLPNPATYSSPPQASYSSPPQQQQQNRTDRFLSSNAAPQQATPHQTYSRELGATEERDGEDRRRVQSQAKTKAGGWASKSLLEREMEMERQRQKEWEEAQQETAKAVRSSEGVDGIGGGVGGRWDVGQWSGYTGGDSQNKGGTGIGAGRRQIVGPRPLPNPR